MGSIRALLDRRMNELLELMESASRCATCRCETKVDSLIGKDLVHYTCQRCGNRWIAEKRLMH